MKNITQTGINAETSASIRAMSRVEAIRRERGLSRLEAAEAMGKSQKTVYNWERSETPITLDDLCGLASVLGTSLADLVGIATDPSISKSANALQQLKVAAEGIRSYLLVLEDGLSQLDAEVA